MKYIMFGGTHHWSDQYYDLIGPVAARLYQYMKVRHNKYRSERLKY